MRVPIMLGLAALLAVGCVKDADGDGWSARDDCDDSSAEVYPDAEERCDAVDNDCDGSVDEDPVDGEVGFADLDEDGYGSEAPELYCSLPEGYVTDNTDCDDRDADIHPGATEICDGADQDCDRDIDEGAGEPWFEDADGDGFGDPETEAPLCDGEGLVANGDDCNDANDRVNPAAEEVCDKVDNDCDEMVDDADPDAVGQEWYLDADGDGYGDEEQALVLCEPLSGYVEEAGDCDDSDADWSPDAEERCGGGDEDCDGLVDDADPDVVDVSAWYPDVDGDGYGDDYSPTEACVPPSGTLEEGGDCDDANPEINPDAMEICGGVDEDCDGLIDDADPDVEIVAYEDADGDGYGADPAVSASCTLGPGLSAVDGDCDDAEPLAYPSNPEVCLDGIDNDCDPMSEAGCRWTGVLDAWTDASLVVRGQAGDALGYPYGSHRASAAAGLLVGAPGIPWLSGVSTGAVYLHERPLPLGLLDALDLDAELRGDTTDDLFGHASLLMDLDEDGQEDLIIGAPGVDDALTGGAVYVYYGDGSPWMGLISPASADLRITGIEAGSGLGYSLANAGQVAGSAAEDLAIGAPGNLAGGVLDREGSVWVIAGGTRWTGVREVRTMDSAQITGLDVGQNLGVSVAGGDLDGDGQSDLVVGSPGNHWWEPSYSYLGHVDVFSGPFSGTFSSDISDARITSDVPSDAAGVFVAVVQDLDGDAREDLVISASGDPSGGTDAGRAALFWGPVSGSLTVDAADATIAGVTDFAYVGEGLSAQDLDADGFADLTVSTWGEGGAVFYGPLADGDWLVTDSDLTVQSSAPAVGAISFGSSTRFAGDIDEDGWEDLLIADPTDSSNGADAGAVYWLSGNPE